MIVVTGAKGFIGSALIASLNREGEFDIVAVDDFLPSQTHRNMANLVVQKTVDFREFLTWFEENGQNVTAVFHIGAITDTREMNAQLLAKQNTEYTQSVWSLCTRFQAKMIYASSAATYGDGAQGFSDDEPGVLEKLVPLNPYAVSKHNFDLWALKQPKYPPGWIGLKFFNVYGPNEYHKGHMASVVFHGYNQIVSSNTLSLFRSYRPDFADGEQARDFVYIKDVVNVCIFMYREHVRSGIYNVGTGKSGTFLELATSLFQCMNRPVKIEFIEMPVTIRNNYQYNTQADITKLRNAGYRKAFHTLAEGVRDYTKYLKDDLLLADVK